MPHANDNTAMPMMACWLGAAGLLPFLALAILPHTHFENLISESALGAYGAVILSFLGGILWGTSLKCVDSSSETSLLLIVGVIASLVGWGALLLPQSVGLVTLALGFLALLAFDCIRYRAGRIPPWYFKLRVSLTSLVVATLMIAAFV